MQAAYGSYISGLAVLVFDFLLTFSFLRFLREPSSISFNFFSRNLGPLRYPIIIAKGGMIESGMSEKEAKKAADKKANEDARFVLPNACDTRMIVTMNTRSLYNFFSLRCCDRAQWEISEVAKQMLLLCKQKYPLLFKHAGPACVSKGRCSEGAYSCGKAAEMRKLFC